MSPARVLVLTSSDSAESWLKIVSKEWVVERRTSVYSYGQLQQQIVIVAQEEVCRVACRGLCLTWSAGRYTFTESDLQYVFETRSLQSIFLVGLWFTVLVKPNKLHDNALIIARICIAILCDQHERQFWSSDASLNGLLAISSLIATRARCVDLAIPANAYQDPNIEPASLVLQICEIDLRLNPTCR